MSDLTACEKPSALPRGYQDSAANLQHCDTGGSAAARARRLALVCYGIQGGGALLYIVVLWIQAYVDTRLRHDVSVDAFSESHRRWRLRTTLIFLLWTSLGGITLPFGIGIVVLVGAYVWYLWRTMRGASLFLEGIPAGSPRAVATFSSNGGAP